MERLLLVLLSISGLPFLLRAIAGRNRAGILLYHDPDPALFDQHLGYLRRHHRLVPFATLVDAIETKDWSRVPSGSLVIHFDDGYRRNFELLKLCKRRDVYPTLYLCSHIIGTRRHFWSKLNGGRVKRLRLVENGRLLEKLRDEVGFTPEREYDERQALSIEEVRVMAKRFDLQSHGRYHFSLFTLRPSALEEELRESRARVEEIAERECAHFSYPYGDHGPREHEAVRRAGYRTARTTEPGWVGAGTAPYRLPILADVPGNISVNGLRIHLTGVPRLLKRLSYLLVTRYIHAARQKMLLSRRGL